MSKCPKFVWRILPAGLFVFFSVFGCVGPVTSLLPAPRSENDTLIVIPVLVLNTGARHSLQDVGYLIRIENTETKGIQSFVVKTSKYGDYYYITGIPEGVYYLKEYIPQGLTRNEAEAIGHDLYITVKKGTLTLFPAKMVIYIYSEYNTYLHSEFIPMGEDQVDRVLQILSQQDNFSIWKIRE